MGAHAKISQAKFVLSDMATPLHAASEKSPPQYDEQKSLSFNPLQYPNISRLSSSTNSSNLSNFVHITGPPS